MYANRSIQFRTIWEALSSRIQESPDRRYFKCGRDWVTFRELGDTSAALAHRLTECGAEPGDRVAVLLPTSQEHVEILFACSLAGFIEVPVNVFLRGSFLRHQLADSGAKILITDETGFTSANEVLGRTSISHVVLVNTKSLPTDQQKLTAISHYEEAVSGPVSRGECRALPQDILSIMYTSGTTGPSKGCMLNNGYYSYVAHPWAIHGWVQHGDQIFTAMPLFHLGGHMALMFALFIDDCSVNLQPEFSASSFLKSARDEGATQLFGVGPMAMAILSQPHHPDDRSLTFRLGGFPPLHPDAQVEFERRFGTPVIAEGLGQTECTPITLDGVDGARRPGANGKAVGHLELRVVDENDTEVADGELGELVVRPLIPDAMYSGYWNREDATLAAWRNLWHHTGDLMRKSDDGFFTFVDRKKDMIRRRGENVSSFEVESAISQYPGIAQCAVSAVPSQLSGEGATDDDIKVSIVLSDGIKVTAEDLFDYFHRNLPYFAVPRYVDIRESLPSTSATSRPMKHELRNEGVSASMWDLEAMGFVIAKADRR